MTIYQISLPKTKNAGEFARFMKDEYLPSIDTIQTRAGKVNNLLLLQKADSDREFLLLIGWSGVPGHELRTNEEMEKTFASFKAKLKPADRYHQLAQWTEENA